MISLLELFSEVKRVNQILLYRHRRTGSLMFLMTIKNQDGDDLPRWIDVEKVEDGTRYYIDYAFEVQFEEVKKFLESKNIGMEIEGEGRIFKPLIYVDAVYFKEKDDIDEVKRLPDKPIIAHQVRSEEYGGAKIYNIIIPEIGLDLGVTPETANNDDICYGWLWDGEKELGILFNPWDKLNFKFKNKLVEFLKEKNIFQSYQAYGGITFYVPLETVGFI
jgi:hypothetical protein